MQKLCIKSQIHFLPSLSSLAEELMVLTKFEDNTDPVSGQSHKTSYY